MVQCLKNGMIGFHYTIMHKQVKARAIDLAGTGCSLAGVPQCADTISVNQDSVVAPAPGRHQPGATAAG